MEHGLRVIPIQIAAETSTYAWSVEQGAWSLESDRKAARSEHGAQACFWAK